MITSLAFEMWPRQTMPETFDTSESEATGRGPRIEILGEYEEQ
ncbi:hypothetical protein GGE61_004787 [Rhizobium leguminosarum]|nr:hypothetical protein [Rhizobium leguminosarum]